MEKMNKFMSDARMTEINEIIERHKREDLQAAKLMREVFISTGDVEWLNTDSFMIAAVQAMSVGFYTGDRTGCRKAYGFVENIIMHPFTCTIVQETGCGEDRFIGGVAEKYGLNPACIAVEVLEDETITGEAEKVMIKNLTTLKNAGIAILLDDFGSGVTELLINLN